MATFTIDGTLIAYTDTGVPAGVPDAATVVFAHGLLFGGWVFRRQIAVLRGQYRCVTFDWRGQGETPPTADGYDMDTLTRDAIGVIRALGVGPVHWVGLSMGGFVGQRLAARHGTLLRSLTLLGADAEAEDPARVGAYRRLAFAWRWFGGALLVGRVAVHMFGPVFRADPANGPVIDEWARRLCRGDRVAVRRAVLGVIERAPVADEITGVTMPTLVVVGVDDAVTPPEHSRRMAARIAGARLHVLPDCGHTSVLEQPAAITALLNEFLASVDHP
ncbi:alpha/beta fold hydrolase [Nocardia bovistercoris]|uniref:Alpha/beta hydrolase n=1 Tax=Nocardia bovistercoris TaxID=2785916 RepID=A0A931N3F7_9NOCA|nr:alpha/beta hydrolase [Nocardia bovistercoris]MBH0776513.1 alpha/beta hydrolase [Nocardia bovistercoris]